MTNWLLKDTRHYRAPRDHGIAGAALVLWIIFVIVGIAGNL